MEAQLERPSHDHQGGAHSVVEGGEQKRSVLKKVKDKAKKIKDTIKHHGHHHHHHHHHQSDDAAAAPMHESSVVRSTNLPREAASNLEKPKDGGRRGDRDHFRDTPASAIAGTESPAEHPKPPNNTPTKGEDSTDAKDSSDKPLTESASEYAHKFVETVGPVCEKVAVASKEYLSEKLKPGEEDKALSEAITDALLHKNNGGEAAPPPRAKVTVSKEVAERLGTDRESKREGEDAVAAGEQSTGDTVAERLQNAVATWLGGSTVIQTAQDSVYNAFVNEDAGSSGSGGAGPTRGEPRHH